ncbi:nucleotidyl transferase AbiEii/AbiGii toxin family protein [Longispora albida]|uniref:nucleotidyl transferase AbiEii/AbiGii toxin family protein n=1 Tax=Longispora albida TaxID=203523 RepID=UPI000373BD6C|nr:nucleotidyl transferase AbiEii/AbiGii toxin family protein [Longispora albida]
MNEMRAALRHVADDLERLGSGWALIGGFAVSARANPRFTSDIDIAVMVHGDVDAEELVRWFTAHGYGLLGSVEHDNGRLALARLTRPVDSVDITIDLLFASSGIELEIVHAAESLDVLGGLILPVAAIGHLIALKLLARDDKLRPQDLMDLTGLLKAATPEDLNVAAQAVRLITERGYNRERDLIGALRELTSAE